MELPQVPASQNGPVALITFEEAKRIVRERISLAAVEGWIPSGMTPGYVLAKPIIALRPNPAFDNSAVDGYLLGVLSAPAGSAFEVVGEIRAGSTPPYPKPGLGKAVRIFTGAPVQAGDFCVAMQEDVTRDGDSIFLTDDVGPSEGVRRMGSDFEAGTELAPAGARIGAAEVALAAWNGLSAVEVFREPRIAICVTGDELLEPGFEVGEGQIYDSNGPMLEALVRSIGPAEVVRSRLADDYEKTKSHLSDLSNSSNLIVVSGGASVGDHDHLPAAVAELGEIYFHGVKVKPGKPVLFGKIGNAFVFALPGNPASSYVTFELFVRDAIRLLSGETVDEGIWIPARYDGKHGPANRDEFVRVRFETRDDKLWAVPVFEQGSFGLRSLAAAQGLARLAADTRFEKGDRCVCLPLAK